jgi:large subunit ribosomal protein L31
LAGPGLYNAGLSHALSGAAMKADIHPDYHDVVFQDVTSDFKFLTRSTLGSKETIKWEDGNEYPLIKVEISSATHPFYTGQNRVVDTAGRIDKFKKRYAAK